jgi:phospholipase/carboxylesterase
VRTPLDRRTLLAAAALAACNRISRGAAASRPGGLDVQTIGDMPEGKTGGLAVVLLHGWGAAGDDLVPLARALARPGTRFFVPAAPLPERGGGRAWWHLDAPDRPAHAHGDEPPSTPPHHALVAARTAVQALLKDIRARHRPDRLVLGGFSQGGMLSIDVALAADPAVDRVAVLSGVLLADSLANLRRPRDHTTPVFVSHGRQDPMLAFAAGERLKDALGRQGFPITWRPFDGGHEIPPAVVRDLAGFIAA